MTSFCIPSSMVSWRRTRHRSSLCLHAVVFTLCGIRLNSIPVKACRCFCSKVIEAGLWNQWDQCRESAGLWEECRRILELSFPLLLHEFLSTVCRFLSCARHTHTQIPSGLPSTSFRGLQCTQRPIYYQPAYKVSYKGKWSLHHSGGGREKRGIYVTLEVTAFQCLWVDGVEVSRGQEVEVRAEQEDWQVTLSSP